MKRALAYLAALCIGFPAAGETLRLGTSPDYRPYAFFGPDHRLQGFDIALGDALCEQMKTDCVWVQAPFANLLTNLASGEYDAVLAALAITPERLALVTFTDSYDEASPEGIFVGLNKAFADIESMAIGVAAGTVHEQHLRNGNIKTRPYQTTAAAFQALLAGEIDLVFGSPGELEPRVFRTSRAAAILGREDIIAGATAIAVEQTNDDLRHRLNRALSALRADGSLARLRKTWLAQSTDL